MTTEEKLEMLKVLLDINDDTMDDKLSVYLKFAENEIISWLYSLVGKPEGATVPEMYEMTEIQAVVAGFNLSGAEEQETHSENGITRKFKYADMLQFIHNNVTAYAKV